MNYFQKSLRCFSISSKALAKKKNANVIKTKYLGRPSNNLTLGVVGLANVGKSTFFQAMTKTSLGTAANYPFATIDPVESLVIVESPKLNHLGQLYQSQKNIPTILNILDIAGLTRNAASGEGLGNKFLSDIRQVDGIFQVVRGFRDDDIIHIEDNKVDPIRDMNIVTEELILKDLEFIETGIEKVGKLMKRPHIDKTQVQLEIDTLNKIQDLLYESRKISTGQWTDKEIDIINTYNFLTAKPTVYLLNVNEKDYVAQQNELKQDVQQWIEDNCPNDILLMFSASYETKINECKTPEELNQFLALNNNKTSAKSDIVDMMRSCLNLISFYTCGPKEARQWSIREGSTMPEAAGLIHTDLQKTFISAQIYKFDDLVNLSPPFNEALLKNSGKQFKCGKNYIVQDGDVVIIKAGNAKAR